MSFQAFFRPKGGNSWLVKNPYRQAKMAGAQAIYQNQKNTKEKNKNHIFTMYEKKSKVKCSKSSDINSAVRDASFDTHHVHVC